MNVKEVNVVNITKLISQQFDQITCFECCKYYIAPETANCGHTLCHNCWKGRHTCPDCSKELKRQQLRVNIPLQKLCTDVVALKEKYQKHFKIKLEEFMLDPICDIISNKDNTKYVKDWLTSSQNQFSAPVSSESPEKQSLNQLEVSTSNIQIHGNTRKTKSPEKVLHVSVPQDDWDKIEPMPETEDLSTKRGKDKENVIGPMDIEPFYFDENEYTSNNPRRSLRNKETKTNDSMIKTNNNNSVNNISSKDSSGETKQKSNKTKQTWNNVKRMRKEFSKLNKMNRNKLNVSIEMCKKTKDNTKTAELPKVTAPPIYEIDDNTPTITAPVPSNVQNIANEADMSELPTNFQPNENPTHLVTEKKYMENNCNLPTPKYNSEIRESNISKVSFYRKCSLQPKITTNSTKINPPKPALNINNLNQAFSNDDIQITFRVGNTITNISIKKKNDSDIIISTDKNIQTSLAPENAPSKIIKSMEINSETQNIKINIEADNNVNIQHKNADNVKNHLTLSKSISGKKNTDSADTATAQFEITESVEKQLSSIMEQAENDQKQSKSNMESQKDDKDHKTVANTEQEIEYLNDLDLFESGSVKEPVQMLKETNYAASEILVSTVRSKNKTQKVSNKRLRVEQKGNIVSQNKKPKLGDTERITINESIDAEKDTNGNILDSEPLNYDSVIGNVFASIDADMKEINSGCKTANKVNAEQTGAEKFENQKESENLFSVYIVDKDNDEDERKSDLVQNKEVPVEIEQNLDDFLTPVTSHNMVTNSGKSKGKADAEADVMDINDDSESVVEETPQKNSSITKSKQKSNETTAVRELSDTQKVKSLDNKKTSVVELSDTSGIRNSKNITVIETAKRSMLETPLTINKFVNQITHKSTPVARKSLNFSHGDDDNNDTDPEQTLCPTNDQIAKTTQEKEFLRKAFEKTPVSMVKPLRSHSMKMKKLCIAGSCLSSSEDMKLKLFCSRHNFTYLDKYTGELTHLVVGVDEENKSQRSVKYMCALAASKWIVSYMWIEKCLEANEVVNEGPFEVLDSTGDPGPTRSRLSKQKLFHGMAFYCFGPFNVLDEKTLKMMLEAAGGLVVKEVQEIKVTTRKGPALLLAEPENTQEDRFIYLAMDLSIVPVNFEWVLNCLGSYALSSIHELLLCPSSILHKSIKTWPRELIAHEDD